MDITFFSHYFPPEGNAPASRVQALCSRWVKAGHKVTVVTCAPNVPDGKVYPGYRNRLRPQYETMDGIRVVRVWTYLAANRGTARRIINYLSYMLSALLWAIPRRKPELVIATSPQFFCGWAGVCLARLRRIPFVLEIRDIWPEAIVAVGAMRNKALLRLLEWLEKKMYAAAGLIVTVGQGYRLKLLEKGVPPEKIAVVMNGVDAELFQPRLPDRELKSSLGLAGKFVCGFTGTIGMACGLEVVLKAARILKLRGRNGISFLLVGDGAVRAELDAMAAREGLANVVFAGRQNKRRMPDFISIMDACLVHLKKVELFRTVMPSKIFEAAGMAKPIIMGVQGDAAELIKKAGAGLEIEPENAGQLADAVCRLADEPESARRMGQSGHDYIIRHFNCDQLAQDYLHLLACMRNCDKKQDL